jgi:hypothetical protein
MKKQKIAGSVYFFGDLWKRNLIMKYQTIMKLKIEN